MTKPLPIKRYAASTPGVVSTTLPTVVHDVPVWDTTDGHLRGSSGVQIDSGNNDRLLFGAWSGAFDLATYAASITLDLSAANQWEIPLAGNPTLATSHAVLGDLLFLLCTQDATGNRKVTWFANIYWDDSLAPIFDPTPNGWDQVVLQCIGFDGYGVPIWNEICRATSAPRKGITILTDGATVTVDPRVSPRNKVTIAGNRTLALTAANAYVGQSFDLVVKQDATGSRLVTWWSGITWAGGVPVLSTAPNNWDWFGFRCTGSGTYDGVIIGQGL